MAEKATKKVAKKAAKKATKKATPSTEIVVRVEQNTIPTTDELSQPMKDGQALTLPKTWVSEKQIMRMVQRTPREHVYSRPAKGGGEWHYVTGAYVEKVLNFVFGFLWDFEVVEHGVQGKQIWVQGRLTVKNASGQTIVKTQFGRADIKYKKNSNEMLDFGNDLKAATTDALKKCASLLGIASDIYGPSEYKAETGKQPKQPPTPPAEDVTVIDAETNEIVEHLCHGATKAGCGADITEQEETFSVKMYGKPLCRACQKLVKEAK